jgi:hypothetical protein
MHGWFEDRAGSGQWPPRDLQGGFPLPDDAAVTDEQP